jgi:hypothetical protein
MVSSSYDVFVCFSSATGGDLAHAVSAGLRRLGFRVFAEACEGDAPDPRRLRLIEETVDVVAVLTPDALGAAALVGNPVREEIAHALRHRRNVVQVRVAGAPLLEDESVGGLFPHPESPAIPFNAARPAESIALLGHRMSSDATVEERRVMRRSKRFFLAAAAILLVGVALQELPRLIERWSRPSLLSPIPPFTLYWSAVGQRPDGERWAAFPVLEKGTVLAKGDRLRFVFSPSADGFAYVVARSAGGEVAVLFPTDAVRGASRVQAGKTYIAPVGSAWWSVEDAADPGSVFIVAGYDTLQNLEELIEEPASTASARRGLLESTISALLDGRHGAAERRVWTGKLHPIDINLVPPAAPAPPSLTLADGHPLVRPFDAQRGLVSSAVELVFAR